MTTVSSTSLSSYATSTSATSAASSTVDWSGLIEAMVQAKLSRADTIDAKITANQTKISAYQQMQTLLQDLAGKAKALANLSGLSNASSNVFNERSAYLTSNGSSSASSALSVDVDSGTATGTYEITIQQIAKVNKLSSATQSSNSTALGLSGSFSIGLDGGSTSDIAVTSNMTLSDLATAINATTSTSGVSASVIKVSDGSYQLLMTGAETGKSVVASAVSGDDVLTSIGVTDASGAFANEIQAAQPAIITFDGVQITRDTNDISDILDGVTFHLYSATPSGASVGVQIAENLTDIQSAINDFVTAYNSFRSFLKTQTATASDGTADSSAVLFSDGTLRDIAQTLQNQLTTTISGFGLADAGISFDSSNNLTIDATALASALNNNLSSLAALFQFNLTSSSSDIRVLAHGSGAPSSFTLDIEVDSSGAITSASVGGDSSLFTISGTRIIGKSGTAFDGFSFSYAGTSSQSIDMTVSYGLADKIYSSSTKAGDVTSGSVRTLIDNLDDQDSQLTTRSTLIKSQAESYRTVLTQRYAKIQQAILEANSTITYLKLLTNSSSS